MPPITVSKKRKQPKHGSRPFPILTHITVGGFKSIAREQSIQIKPLTVLAGANSSGKSSMMQPLLLMKQTLNSPFDPGALLMNGPNVRFTSPAQMISQLESGPHERRSFHIGLGWDDSDSVTIAFQKGSTRGFEIESMQWQESKDSGQMRPGMEEAEILKTLPARLHGFLNRLPKSMKKLRFEVEREACFLEITVYSEADRLFGLSPFAPAAVHLSRAIHLPGNRGNPERIYPLTAVVSNYPGVFHSYVASVILKWQEEKSDTLEHVREDLAGIGLARGLQAVAVSDTDVALSVARTTRPGDNGIGDLINIADAGFGVSQALPVIVALRAATKGQLVYIEQPEIHLHPKAQLELARLLISAAERGVSVVVETHSDHLLLGIQSEVAHRSELSDLVVLHWFERDASGATNITSARIDEFGSYEKWPVDFGRVTLGAQHEFLKAVELKRRGNRTHPSMTDRHK